eukprot:6924203-Prymnesium_polylepis.2
MGGCSVLWPRLDLARRRRFEAKVGEQLVKVHPLHPRRHAMVVFLAALLDHVLADPPAPRHGAVDVHRLERFEVLDEAIEQLHRLGVGTALAVVALAQRADHKVDLEHLLLDELGHVVVEHGNAELLCHVVQPRQVEALHDGGGDAQPEDGHLVHLRILEEPHAGQRLVERRHREAHRLDVLVREQELEPRLRDHRLLVGAVDVDGRSVLLLAVMPKAVRISAQSGGEVSLHRWLRAGVHGDDRAGRCGKQHAHGVASAAPAYRRFAADP